MKVSVVSLCTQAGVGRQTFYEALKGVQVARPATLAKLSAALGRFKLSYTGDPGPMAAHATYRMALLLSAQVLGADPRQALFSDPADKATANKEWRESARVRRLAFWLANGLLGFKVTEIARAAGVTKQAVSSAIKELEDDESAEMRRIRRQLEEIFA